MTAADQALIHRFAIAFGYPSDAEAMRALASRANARHVRPVTLAREILAKIRRAPPRAVTNQAAKDGLPAGVAYDDFLAVSRAIRTAVRTRTDLSAALAKNHAKETA